MGQSTIGRYNAPETVNTESPPTAMEGQIEQLAALHRRMLEQQRRLAVWLEKAIGPDEKRTRDRPEEVRGPALPGRVHLLWHLIGESHVAAQEIENLLDRLEHV